MGSRDTPAKPLAWNAHHGYHGDMTIESPIPAGELKLHMRPVLDRVQHHGAHIPVSRHGESVGMLIPMAWYEQAEALMSEHGPNGENPR